uniref:HMG box domain-containing protein n=1 Tax=Anas platyrhynchos platyrhynchos TaxID=8840 RepID=U3IJI5_ANAPP
SSSSPPYRWSQEDMLTLLECMKNNLPSNDGSKFKTTESHLDWEKVAFKDFSGEMCKMKWMEISNEVRKFRTLTELIMDAEEHVKNPYKGKKLKKHPDFPKKPLTPYFRFFMEKRAKYAKLHPEMSNLDLTKILSKKYKELPEKKKVGAPPTSIPILHPLGMPPVPILLPGAQFAPLQAGGVTPWERHGASEVPVPVPLAVPAPCSLVA